MLSFGSDKFFLNNILDELPKDVIIATLQKHISELSTQQEYWEKWQQTKNEKDNTPEA